MANLPYNVATPLISNLLALDRPPCTMTITVQKEVADRIVARPGVKDYGGLAIWIQSQCRAEIVRVLAPRFSGRGPRSPRPSCRSRSTKRFVSGFPIGLFFTSSCDRCSFIAAKSCAANCSVPGSSSTKPRSMNCWPAWGWNPPCGPSGLGQRTCSAFARRSARQPFQVDAYSAPRKLQAFRGAKGDCAAAPGFAQQPFDREPAFIKMKGDSARKEKLCTLSKCRARP